MLRDIAGEPSSPPLTRRAWTAAAGIAPVVGIATVAGCCLAAAVGGQSSRYLIVPVVLLIGLVLGLTLHRLRGPEVIHRRVAESRSRWAQGTPGATLDPDGPADAHDVALALPRGWRVEIARGRLRFPFEGSLVRAETWVLRAAVGSKRSRRRRELVQVAARTGPVRQRVQIGASVDPLLAPPSSSDGPEPTWMPQVRARVAQHQDMLATLTIGDDRVLLLALDDPRPATLQTRAQLVCDVAEIIG